MLRTELRLHEATFRAFGSNCRVVSNVQPSVGHAIARLEDLESRWSRFRPNSEISRLNSSPDRWIEISAITATLIERANEAARRTDGIFNPTLHDRLCAMGYDASHELLERTDRPLDREALTPGVRSISQVELEGGAARRPTGGFDPGGVGKGLAADLVLADLVDDGASWAMVSLGGDIRFGGHALASTGWTVHIEDPRSAGVWGTTTVYGGALATSSTTSRRWSHQESVQHHLIDPATNGSAQTGRVAATVWAAEAWWADVVAKSIVIEPSIDRAQLEAWDVAGLVFLEGETESLGLDAEVTP